MKKIFAACLAAAALLSLTACNNLQSEMFFPPKEQLIPAESFSAQSTFYTTTADTSINADEVGTMGTVNILGLEYDIATTTRLDLRKRDLDSTALTDNAPFIGQLSQLNSLELGFNNIGDISPLSELSVLDIRTISLTGNDIKDIAPLKGFTGLEKLWLGNNGISDISALGELTELTELDISGNEITDISALSGLTKLETLNMERVPVTDFSPLYGLKSLTCLKISEPATEELTRLGEELPDCLISFSGCELTAEH
ncbi:MAG: leucine-rich repeat domain-containing protein [Oscillospiraceae bacterium]|nr:leucine-rich repeat domain-containing protein [Oscillospiraceae bacterium]